MTSAKTNTANLEMKENTSQVDEGLGTTRLVTKDDGSKVPYSEDHLRASLNCQLEGLNREYMNVDIILQKVSSGLYNGKFFCVWQRTFAPTLDGLLSSQSCQAFPMVPCAS